MLKALIFDVDGTLSETEETHRSAFNQAFDELELGWNWDQPLYGKLLDVTGGMAKIALQGKLGPRGIRYLEEQVEAARAENIGGIVFDMTQLDSISSEALRYIVFSKQTFGSSFKLSVTGANPAVKSAIESSELNDEVSWL